MSRISYIQKQLLAIKRIVAFATAPANAATTDSLPALKTGIQQLQSDIVKTDTKLAGYKIVLKGIAADKSQARKNLASISYSIMSSVRAFALNNNDNTLAEKMKVQISILQREKYNELLQITSNAFAIIQPLVSQLAAYNVTNQKMEDWHTAISKMANLLNGPQSAIAARKTLGQVIVKDMAQTMTFVRTQLTPLVANFYNIPAYYIGWYNALRIDNTGTRHNGLQALVLNDINQPQFGIKVTIDQYTDPDTGKTYKPASAITNEAGIAHVSEFFPGMRTITISGKNIQTKTFPAISFSKAKIISKTFHVQNNNFIIPESQPAPADKAPAYK